MKYVFIIATLLAGFLDCGVGISAEAAPPGRPLLSGMKNENDSVVQHVRDALTAFSGVNKRWPEDLDDLSAFARQYSLPLDFAGFQKANYTVQNEAGAEVAVFEFVMKGSTTRGAFALANYTVQK